MQYLNFEIYTVLIFGINNLCYAELYKGDSCQVRVTGKSGTCELLGKCLSVLDNIRNGKRDHTSCGFQGNEPIVCCPINKIKMTTKKSNNDLPPTLNRISAKKCFEYKNAIFEKQEIITTVGSKPHIQLTRQCAIDTVPLIVGGVITNVGEFPHMAALGYSTLSGLQWLCGGSLISDQFILTVSHCLRLSNGNVTLVKLGAHKILSTNSSLDNKNNNKDENHAIDIEVAQIYLHEKYRTNLRYNDIGLIRLKQIITFNPFIRPICLPELTSNQRHDNSADDDHQQILIGTGWGDEAHLGSKSNVLRKVKLEIFGYNECQAKLLTIADRKSPNGIENKTQLCAGSHTQVKDTCQGDSGGPLQKQHESYDCMYTIIGLVSFGIGCGKINTPGVYTRVSGYLQWIEEIVWQ